MVRMTAEKESLKKDQIDSLSSMQKLWYKRGKWKPDRLRPPTQKEKKAYQHVRNIYLYKQNRVKCLYLNATVEDTHSDQRNLFGLLDSLTKEPGGNYGTHSDISLEKALDAFSRIKLKPYTNLSNLKTT